jgi:hypothetical protein
MSVKVQVTLSDHEANALSKIVRSSQFSPSKSAVLACAFVEYVWQTYPDIAKEMFEAENVILKTLKKGK